MVRAPRAGRNRPGTDQPPPIYISGLGDKAIRLAAQIADGYMAYVGQVGGELEGFFEFYAGQILPRLRG